MKYSLYSNEYQEWVKALKVEDKVVINVGRYGHKNYKMTTIVKVTPTGIIKTKCGRTYNNDGWERGKRDAWGGRTHLEPITQDIIDKIETDKLLYEIGKVKFNELPLEILREIVKAVSKNKEDEQDEEQTN